MLFPFFCAGSEEASRNPLIESPPSATVEEHGPLNYLPLPEKLFLPPFINVMKIYENP
jgi:hypothetical protein